MKQSLNCFRESFKVIYEPLAKNPNTDIIMRTDAAVVVEAITMIANASDN